MENEDFEILIYALVNMTQLRVLNMNVNRITGPFFTKFLDKYIENEAINGLKLESILMSQNFLREDGVVDLFARIHKMLNIKYLNLNANKCTEYILVDFIKFIHQLDPNRPLTIDFKKQDIRPALRQEFKDRIAEALMSKDISGSYIRKRFVLVNM